MMKKIFIATAVLATTVSTSSALDRTTLRIGDVSMYRSGDSVSVSFDVTAGNRVASASSTLYITPVVRSGEQEIRLAAIAVQGSRAATVAGRYDSVPAVSPAHTIRRGGTATYRTTFPYSAWMRGADIELDGEGVGCCAVKTVELGILAHNILDGEDTRNVELVERLVQPYTSTGAALANRFPFVAPMTEIEADREFGALFRTGAGLDSNDPAIRNTAEKFIDDNREGSISVYFRQGKKDVDRYYMDNNRALSDLITVVRAISSSGDSRVSRIVVAGFASPEGSLELNNRLSWNRAVALKRFITENSSVQPSQIYIFKGSIDWHGLREIVADGDMYEKQQVLDIIDNTPIWDAAHGIGRHGQLMRLGGGHPYRYMQREYFPYMRQAAFIKVFFEKK